MPTTKTITLYKYGELSDDAKEKARQWYSEHVTDYDWWDSTYEDAETIGLKITEFDCDRGNMIKGKVITSCPEMAEAIIANHGDGCDTYKLAEEFLRAIKDDNRPSDTDEDADDSEWEAKREELEEEFEQAVLECYLSSLKSELEWMYSDEYLEDGIEANDYDFLENGKRA